jgi:hypothetical protein
VGVKELDNQVFIAQQGLTSGQVLPTYTNVSNGFGIILIAFSAGEHQLTAGPLFYRMQHPTDLAGPDGTLYQCLSFCQNLVPATSV